MQIKWVSLSKANAFVVKHHRHHLERQGHIFSLGLFHNGELFGVAICGRPSAGPLDNGDCMEVYRCCILESKQNGCSMLYSACARIATELGCVSMITYTLESESGDSLIATGWVCVDENCGGRGKASGNRKGRVNKNITLFGDITKSEDGPRKRWEKILYPKTKTIILSKHKQIA